MLFYCNAVEKHYKIRYNLDVNTVFNLSDGTKNWPDSGNYLFGQNSLWIGLITILLCSIVFYLVTHVLFKQYIYRKDLDK